MNRKCKKAINFDLFTKELKRVYPGPDYRHAYYDIRFYFIKHHFSHRQGSGYISDEQIADQDIYNLIKSLSKRYPWLSASVNKMDVTDIGKQHDLREIFDKNPVISKRKRVIQNNERE